MSTFRNILLYLAVIALMVFAIFQWRAAWADPCDPPQGWTGEIVGYDGQHQFVLTDANLAFSAYNGSEYIFSMLPDYHQVILPFSAVTATYDPTACTYHVMFDDVVFTNGFEE